MNTDTKIPPCPKALSSSPAASLLPSACSFTHFGPAWLPTALFGLAILAGGALVLPPAWRALQKRRLDINVLMAVAVTGAWIIGEYAEAASVVFLFAFSELLESWAAGRARNAVTSLLELSPLTALVLSPEGREVETPVAEVPPSTRKEEAATVGLAARFLSMERL